MATIVASRYAVLSVDDEDDLLSKKKKVSNKKSADGKPQISTVKANCNSKKKKKQENTQSQNIKNQKAKSGNTSKKKKQPALFEPRKENSGNYDTMDDATFEEDLSKAILLSKLDYEQKKDYYETIQKTQLDKKTNNKKSKKNKKIMTLSEFNNLGSQSAKESTPEKHKTEELEGEFFNLLDEDIKNELSKEHLLERQRAKDFNSQESLTLILYKACIEKKDREINDLKDEVERLNTQLKNVKLRNLKLCQIIGNGEMKDKAEVLMEVERLQTIKDELSSEVASLHIQLEQERSKVRQLMSEHKSKDKSKKHHTSS